MSGVTLKQTRISPPFTERRTAACSGYRRTHTDTGKSSSRTKYRNNLRQNQACVSLKQKERKLYESQENKSLLMNSAV